MSTWILTGEEAAVGEIWTDESFVIKVTGKATHESAEDAEQVG
jgi:hypothetical protein